jgi:hypothetical protein
MFKEYRRRLMRGANLDPTAPLAGVRGTIRDSLQTERAQPSEISNAEDATPDGALDSEVSPPSLPPGG